MNPTVSVVIATYNLSAVLRHAIRSVLDSSLQEWELIVVGDHCTDDTADCVAAFADPRIRFVNLPGNCGDQSGPNNHGLALSSGRYVAFLNQDDLYLPDHLERAVRALEANGADLVWTACAVAGPKGYKVDGAPCAFMVGSGPGPTGYTPFHHYAASSWVFRRELAQRVGPWESAGKVFVTPSQSWLYRARRLGATLEFLPHIGVVCIYSSHRRNSYLSGDGEHARIYTWMQSDPRFRERLCEAAAIGAVAHDLSQNIHHLPLVQLIPRACLRPAYFLLNTLGIHPRSLNQALLYGRRGGFTRAHRKFSGAAASTKSQS